MMMMRNPDHIRHSLQVLLAHAAYLSPGEASSLRVRDLVARVEGSNTGLRWWSVVVAPSELGVPSKTLTFDDTIVLDHPTYLGELLRRYASARVYL